MNADPPKRLRMFAGPNGSGKTTLVRRLAKEFSPSGFFQVHRFLNADEIFLTLREGRGIPLSLGGQVVSTDQLRSALLVGGRLPADHLFLRSVEVKRDEVTAPPSACDPYVAAALTDFLRDQLLAAGRSFGFETVMSHPSKVEVFARARAAGYRTYLYFIATESPVLNVFRVENRAALGGHDVPETKVIERYQRCLGLVADALAHAHRAFLFDNSGAEPVWLAQLTRESGFELKVPVETLPMWFRTWVMPHYAAGK